MYYEYDPKDGMRREQAPFGTHAAAEIAPGPPLASASTIAPNTVGNCFQPPTTLPDGWTARHVQTRGKGRRYVVYTEESSNRTTRSLLSVWRIASGLETAADAPKRAWSATTSKAVLYQVSLNPPPSAAPVMADAAVGHAARGLGGGRRGGRGGGWGGWGLGTAGRRAAQAGSLG